MPDRPVLNLSGYRFVALDDLEARRERLQSALEGTGVRGTVLLAAEGVNVALAGTDAACRAARAALDADPPLAGLRLKESRSDAVPFARLKVRVRDEIIAFDGAGSAARQAARPAAPALAPETLKAWLDEGRELVLLDTRNAYEVASGTFEGAEHLGIASFRDFGDAARAALADGRLDPSVPVVTFCTGGVRCEKAAPWLLEHGVDEVWQVDGGVLAWFERCGGAHWAGRCFVFDDRVEIDASLAPTGATLCGGCQRAVPPGASCPCGGPARSGSASGDTSASGPDAAVGDRDAETAEGHGRKDAAGQPSRTAIDTV